MTTECLSIEHGTEWFSLYFPVARRELSFVGSYSCWILSKKIVFPREIERDSTSLVSRKYQCLKIVSCLFYLFTCRYLNIFICQIIRDLLKVWMVLPQDMLSENVSPIVGFWALGARVRSIQRVNIYIIDEERT